MTSGISLACTCHPKGLPRYILCLPGLPGQIRFLQDPGALPGHPRRPGWPQMLWYSLPRWSWRGPWSRNRSLSWKGTFRNLPRPHGKNGSNGHARTYRRKRKAVNHKITASWYRKGMDQFLPKQLRHLQQCPPGPVEPGTATKFGKEVPVVTFYKRIPGIFRIHPNQLAADA